MVNTILDRTRRPMAGISRLVAAYVAVVVATIVALAVLTEVQPDQATDDAWIHAAIVAVFAVLLPIRVRAARRGNVGARRAVGVIAAVLVTVNVLEAAIPGLFPVWMRVEMVGIAAIMAGIGLLSLRARRGGRP